jgi:hypothetical protein
MLSLAEDRTHGPQPRLYFTNLNLKTVDPKTGRPVRLSIFYDRFVEKQQHGKRFIPKRLHSAFDCIFANAINCLFANEPLKAGRGTKFYGRKRNHTGARRDIFNATFDWLVENDLLERKRGYWDKEEQKGEYTAYFVTELFEHIIFSVIEIKNIEMRSHPGPALKIRQAAMHGLINVEIQPIKLKQIEPKTANRKLVRLKTRKSKVKPSEDLPVPKNSQIAKESRKLIRAYAKMMKQHEVRLQFLLLEPNLQRIFTTDMELHGRFYTRPFLDSYQKYGKQIRKTLKIDGEAVTEWDFSSTHLRLAYHIEGHRAKSNLYDLRKHLAPELNVRAVIKKLINTALNAKSQNDAIHSVSQWIARNRKEDDTAFPDFKKKDLKFILSAALKEHSAVKGYFCSDAGMKLMFYDSEICFGVLSDFTEKGKPIMPVHDSFICKASDGGFLQDRMKANWKLVTNKYGKIGKGYKPVISKVY